jgi:hypothetical protein
LLFIEMDSEKENCANHAAGGTGQPDDVAGVC